MPKAKKKSKHLDNDREEEKEGEERDENRGEERQERASKAKKSRITRFLARLQRAFACLTTCYPCKRKGKYSTQEEEPSSEVPGTSNIHLEDEKGRNLFIPKTVNVTSDGKEKPEDQSLKTDGQEKGKLKTIYVEQQIVHQDQDQIHSRVAVYIQFYAEMLTTIYVQQQILQHYHQIQEQIQGQMAVYAQYIQITISICSYVDRLTTAYVQRQTVKYYHLIQDHILSHIQYTGGQKSEKTAGEETEDREANGTPKTSQSPSSCHEDKNDDVCLEELTATSTPVRKTCTVPLTLKSFTVHALLGRGGFGEVLLATDIIRQEHVAVKAINKRIYTEYGYSLAEREILHLSHENHYLVHGLAAFQSNSYVYYVMELATKGDLNHVIEKNSRLDVSTSRFITAEVICGVQFLHKKGIIHHDLKPGNILLTKEGHIKLADFGISLTDVYERTKHQCAGAARLTDPEMVKCMDYGRGVDFLALGVTLYQMSTGEHPFITKTPQYPAFLTRDTVKILKELLRKDPHSRLGVKGNIRKHKFFSAINWNDVENKTAVPPEILVSVPEQINMTATLCYQEEPYSIKSQELFEDFSFVCPAWSDTYHPTNIGQITE